MPSTANPIDRTAPSVIASSTVKTYLMPTEVDMQAAGAVDDPQGVGVYAYNWYRDGQYIASTFTPEYSDPTVAAGSTHTYCIAAVDYDATAPLPLRFRHHACQRVCQSARDRAPFDGLVLGRHGRTDRRPIRQPEL